MNLLKSILKIDEQQDKEKICDSTIISYGDIIYEESVIKKLIENTDDISLIVDKKCIRV